MKIHDQGRAVLHVMEHLKGVQFGHAKAPARSIDASLKQLLATAQTGWSALDDATGRAAANRTLSAIGVAEATQQHRETLDAAIGRLHHNAADAGQKARAQRARRLAPPPLDPSDAVGALYDREIRERYTSLTETQKAAALADDRVLHALARDPFVNTPKQVALGALRSRAEADARRGAGAARRGGGVGGLARFGRAGDAHGVRREREGRRRRGDRGRRAPAHRRRRDRSSGARARCAPRSAERVDAPRAAWRAELERFRLYQRRPASGQGNSR